MKLKPRINWNKYHLFTNILLFNERNRSRGMSVFKVKSKVLRQNYFYYFIRIILSFQLHRSFSRNVYNLLYKSSTVLIKNINDFVAKICFLCYKYQWTCCNLLNVGGRWSPLHFFENRRKVLWFSKKLLLFWKKMFCLYASIGLNSHLKMQL